MSLVVSNIASSTIDFQQEVIRHGVNLRRSEITTLQVNIGKRCNQACHHCHVESGPEHTENMQAETVDRLILLLEKTPNVHTVDITGGAPELNPNFRRFVSAVRAMNKEVIDRCNLTVLFESGQEDTAQFLADNFVQVSASLPCYLEENVNSQRGKGVFEQSIQALQVLNELGYGKEESGLILNLVYNPIGAMLPPDQQGLQLAYKQKLREEFAIEFNQLFTITNMPIKRFARQLQREGRADEYMQMLINSFNPKSADCVMCKSMLSIGFDGRVYDCDFNQMLDLGVDRLKISIWDIDQFSDVSQKIVTAAHCYACTAGSGSSCGGSLVNSDV